MPVRPPPSRTIPAISAMTHQRKPGSSWTGLSVPGTVGSDGAGAVCVGAEVFSVSVDTSGASVIGGASVAGGVTGASVAGGISGFKTDVDVIVLFWEKLQTVQHLRAEPLPYCEGADVSTHGPKEWRSIGKTSCGVSSVKQILQREPAVNPVLVQVAGLTGRISG